MKKFNTGHMYSGFISPPSKFGMSTHKSCQILV
uniref:Uncharacterized protein n=1 Tax=Anguilla anguilla TaxID=7936 RepID=A0A0E9Q8J7_ANGAN